MSAADMFDEKRGPEKYPELGSRRTWQRRRQKREGPPFIQVGNRILYRRTAVERWLDSLEVKPRRSRAA